ncbi:MAG: hypothetical protein Kow0068_15540 [Marinilabiliales bacterium]
MRLLYIILLFVFLSSCEKILDVELEEKEKKVVLNCLFTPDSLFNINLSRSQGILDTHSIEFINNAEIKLYEDGNFIANFNLTDSLYGFYSVDSFYPAVGKHYSVEVNTGNASETVYAANYIPQPVSFEIGDTSTRENNMSKQVLCNIKLSDPEGIDNYYCLELLRYYSFDFYEVKSKIYKTNVYFYLDDQILGDFVESNGSYLFSDEFFNGKEINFKIYIHYGEISNYDSDSVKVYFLMHSVSREYYRYITSYERNANASANPFAEPVQVFSNVNNGLGIFAGSSTYVDSLYFIGYHGGEIYYDY